ncbi:MAG: hypothetical protein RMM07_14300, partial [Anaerolineae bacterium]|nr:hypothetical protein [Anaerolineae bacterium]
MSILTEDGDFSFEYRSPEEIKKENELRRISELNHARITLNYRYKVSEVDDSLLIIIDEAIRIGVK